MDKAQFWQLIEASKNNRRDHDQQAVKLQKLLAKLDAEEIRSFDDILGSLVQQAYTWDLWAVAYIIQGGCSNDGFHDFRLWLVGQGQEYFEAALGNPERAADAAEADDLLCEWEELGYVADQAYEQKTGVEICGALFEEERPNSPEQVEKQPSPAGTQWKDEKELKARFPRLWKKFE